MFAKKIAKIVYSHSITYSAVDHKVLFSRVAEKVARLPFTFLTI